MSSQAPPTAAPPAQLPYLDCLLEAIEAYTATPPTAELTELARCSLTDFLAASLYASTGPVARAGLALVPYAGAGDCTLVGQRVTVPAICAAFHNAMAVTSDDLDDAHRFVSGLHTSAVTLPVALALAEADDLPGELFIQAVAAGYEVASRLGRAMDLALRERGFHASGAVGPFGAAAVAGVLLGFDRETQGHALGIAASAAGGLFAFMQNGASVRHTHSGWACSRGLEAALLARAGLTGPRQPFEGPNGFVTAYAGRCDAAHLTGTGSPELANAYHKLYATCGHAFPAITGLLALRDAILAEPGGLEAVEHITIGGYRATACLTRVVPASTGEAAFSLPTIAGVLLVRGHAGRDDMRLEHALDPRVRAVAEKVTVVEDPEINAAFPRLRAGTVTVRFNNGKTLCQRVEAPLGMPENPVSRGHLEDKLIDAAKNVLPAANIEALLRGIANLHQPGSLRPLIRLLRPVA